MATFLMTVREAATALGVSEAVRRWANGGRLPIVRVGRALRIDQRALEAIVARGALDPPEGAADAAGTGSASPPLPWAVRQAERFLAALQGDVRLARQCLDMLEARGVAEGGADPAR